MTKGWLKEKDDNLTGDDIREGLTAIVSIKLGEPQFEGQTKTKLGNTEAKSFVQKTCNDWLKDWFDRNPAEGQRDLHEGVLNAARARIAARKARDLSVARACSAPTRSRASWPTARAVTRVSARSTSSRATAPAARPSPVATPGRRRSCRSAARSSTSRRRASTGS